MPVLQLVFAAVSSHLTYDPRNGGHLGRGWSRNRKGHEPGCQWVHGRCTVVYARKQFLVYVLQAVIPASSRSFRRDTKRIAGAVTRNVGIRAYGGQDKMRSVDKVAVSGVAGSAAGAVAGLARKFDCKGCLQKPGISLFERRWPG